MIRNMVSLMGFLRIITFALLLAASSAGWASVSFNLEWSGEAWGNSATATGMITFDETLLPNPGSIGNEPTATAGVLDFMMTVTGASAGNGTFNLSHITTWIWSVGSPIDLTQELIGQAGFLDFNLGYDTASLGAPESGPAAFLITTNAAFSDGDLLSLISMTPKQVPVPNVIFLFGLGLAGLGLVVKRRKMVA